MRSRSTTGAETDAAHADILTPGWRVRDHAEVRAPEEALSHGQGATLSAEDEVVVVPTEPEDDPDSSDEAYVRRHEELALEERRRWTGAAATSTPQQSSAAVGVSGKSSLDGEAASPPASAGVNGGSGAVAGMKRGRSSGLPKPCVPLYPPPLECWMAVQMAVKRHREEAGAVLEHRRTVRRRRRALATVGTPLHAFAVIENALTRERTKLRRALNKRKGIVPIPRGKGAANSAAAKVSVASPSHEPAPSADPAGSSVAQAANDAVVGTAESLGSLPVASPTATPDPQIGEGSDWLLDASSVHATGSSVAQRPAESARTPSKKRKAEQFKHEQMLLQQQLEKQQQHFEGTNLKLTSESPHGGHNQGQTIEILQSRVTAEQQPPQHGHLEKRQRLHDRSAEAVNQRAAGSAFDAQGKRPNESGGQEHVSLGHVDGRSEPHSNQECLVGEHEKPPNDYDTQVPMTITAEAGQRDNSGGNFGIQASSSPMTISLPANPAAVAAAAAAAGAADLSTVAQCTATRLPVFYPEGDGSSGRPLTASRPSGVSGTGESSGGKFSFSVTAPSPGDEVRQLPFQPTLLNASAPAVAAAAAAATGPLVLISERQACHNAGPPTVGDTAESVRAASQAASPADATVSAETMRKRAGELATAATESNAILKRDAVDTAAVPGVRRRVSDGIRPSGFDRFSSKFAKVEILRAENSAPSRRNDELVHGEPSAIVREKAESNLVSARNNMSSPASAGDDLKCDVASVAPVEVVSKSTLLLEEAYADFEEVELFFRARAKRFLCQLRSLANQADCPTSKPFNFCNIEKDFLRVRKEEAAAEAAQRQDRKESVGVYIQRSIDAAVYPVLSRNLTLRPGYRLHGGPIAVGEEHEVEPLEEEGDSAGAIPSSSRVLGVGGLANSNDSDDSDEANSLDGFDLDLNAVERTQVHRRPRNSPPIGASRGVTGIVRNTGRPPSAAAVAASVPASRRGFSKLGNPSNMTAVGSEHQRLVHQQLQVEQRQQQESQPLGSQVDLSSRERQRDENIARTQSTEPGPVGVHEDVKFRSGEVSNTTVQPIQSLPLCDGVQSVAPSSLTGQGSLQVRHLDELRQGRPVGHQLGQCGGVNTLGSGNSIAPVGCGEGKVAATFTPPEEPTLALSAMAPLTSGNDEADRAAAQLIMAASPALGTNVVAAPAASFAKGSRDSPPAQIVSGHASDALDLHQERRTQTSGAMTSATAAPFTPVPVGGASAAASAPIADSRPLTTPSSSPPVAADGTALNSAVAAVVAGAVGSQGSQPAKNDFHSVASTVAAVSRHMPQPMQPFISLSPSRGPGSPLYAGSVPAKSGGGTLTVGPTPGGQSLVLTHAAAVPTQSLQAAHYALSEAKQQRGTVQGENLGEGQGPAARSTADFDDIVAGCDSIGEQKGNTASSIVKLGTDEQLESSQEVDKTTRRAESGPSGNFSKADSGAGAGDDKKT